MGVHVEVFVYADPQVPDLVFPVDIVVIELEFCVRIRPIEPGSKRLLRGKTETITGGRFSHYVQC